MLVFVDESGDSGMKQRPGSSQYFLVTAIVFEENEEADVCQKKIAECREELKLHPNFEFKFYSCSDRFRECFLRAVVPSAFFHHTVVLNKAKLYGQGFQDKDSFYKYATSLVFQNAKPHLRDATVIIDKCGDRRFRDQLSKYLKRKMNEDGNSLIRRVRMEGSHSNDLLQLADMVCGSIARSLKDSGADVFRFRRIIGAREARVQIWPK